MYSGQMTYADAVGILGIRENERDQMSILTAYRTSSNIAKYEQAVIDAALVVVLAKDNLIAEWSAPPKSYFATFVGDSVSMVGKAVNFIGTLHELSKEGERKGKL